MTSEPLVIPTEYWVTTIPETYPEWSTWAIKVSRRGPDRWAVERWGRVYSRSQAKAKNPVPVYERSSSGRSDYFKNTYRFPLDEALELAKLIAPKVITNNLNAEQYMAWCDALPKEGA